MAEDVWLQEVAGAWVEKAGDEPLKDGVEEAKADVEVVASMTRAWQRRLQHRLDRKFPWMFPKPLGERYCRTLRRDPA